MKRHCTLQEKISGNPNWVATLDRNSWPALSTGAIKSAANQVMDALMAGKYTDENGILIHHLRNLKLKIWEVVNGKPTGNEAHLTVERIESDKAERE